MVGRIVIIGTGFAGVWSALAAKRLLQIKGKQDDVEVLVISPKPALVIRPRLYQAYDDVMSFPLGELFNSTGIAFVQGMVETIDTADSIVKVESNESHHYSVRYDRLILAAVSALVRPEGITGI
jgi:NADH dehydrogenase FAD-containing subunit